MVFIWVKMTLLGLMIFMEESKKLLITGGAGFRFHHVSTDEVYVDPEVHPQKESYVGSVNPIGIRSCFE